jgi:hypothetical protein
MQILWSSAEERLMGSHVLICVATMTLLAGCETQQQMVARMHPKALQTAVQRGSFELDCPSATARVLSEEAIEAADAFRYVPSEHAEYTVGVEGCGRRATYAVVCAAGGTGCFADATDSVFR